jgi:ornithine carbamoyltransferase
MRHLLHMLDVTSEELTDLLARAARLKAAWQQRIPSHVLAGRVTWTPSPPASTTKPAR